MDSELSGGITVLGLDTVEADHLVDYMREKYNIVTAILKDMNGARICTHIWITFKQIDVLLNALKELKTGI
jgi:selenocysteine lyase/cysteine desulfurase